MSKSAPWYSIRRKTAVVAAALGVVAAAEILIYGDIGESYWEETVSAATFVRELSELDVDAITVRINSIGGSVPDGLAIYNAMRRHKATITVEVDGMAFSIASLIAVAGDKVLMASNALLMVHAPWTYTAGNSAELREQADQLDTWAAAMSTSYAARTGDQPAMLVLLTDGKDHYYTAQEALHAKLIDDVTDPSPVAASAHRDLPLNRYRSLPAALQPAAGIPAAAAANPLELTPMPQANPAAATPNPAPAIPDASAIAAAAVAADQARRTGIRASFAPFAAREGVADLLRTCEDNHACTVEAASTQLLTHLGANAGPVAGAHVSTVEDERDKRRTGIALALGIRGGIDKNDGANPWRGYTLTELARASLEGAGVRTAGMGKMELIAAAFTHGNSDYPLILANVANKSLMKGFEEADETFQLWTSAGTLSDFKPGKRVDLSSFPSLRKVEAGAEYKYATVGERGATVMLATYGELFSINRQAIINDDVGAFTKIPRGMGRAAIRTVGDLCYAILTGNPVFTDGKTLFHADHKNLLAGASISTASVDAMGAAMALQTDGGGAKAMNMSLATLIVPRALQGAAKVVRDSENEVGASAKNNTVPNSVRGTFEVVSDARLDLSSPTGWFGAANANMHDTVEVNYLDGNDRPYLEAQQGWNVDGTQFKVRIDAGVDPLDFRGLAKNPGA